MTLRDVIDRMYQNPTPEMIYYAQELERLLFSTGGQRIGRQERARLRHLGSRSDRVHVTTRGPITHIEGDIDQVLAELRKRIADD